jgi:hypothetical protein
LIQTDLFYKNTLSAIQKKKKKMNKNNNNNNYYYNMIFIKKMKKTLKFRTIKLLLYHIEN